MQRPCQAKNVGFYGDFFDVNNAVNMKSEAKRHTAAPCVTIHGPTYNTETRENPMQQLIDRLKLVPHPEGGFYREVYRSGQAVSSSATKAPRQALTHIYFLLLKGQVSRFHRVLHDEVWNYYEGAPLRLLRWHGATIEEQLIGPGEANYCTTIVGGDFQAAESCGDYTLVGCTVAPGFDFADFTFADDRQWLIVPEQARQTYQRFR